MSVVDLIVKEKENVIMTEEFVAKFQEVIREEVKHDVFLLRNDSSNNSCSMVRVYCDSPRQIYFQLTSEQNDSVCRLEFWIDTYAIKRAEKQGALQRIVEKSRRDLYLISFYSALGCRCHRRIANENDLKKDVSSLYEKVKDIITEKFVADEEVAVGAKPLVLPCQCTIGQVAEMLNRGEGEVGNRLEIPAVQRGKVWNAARVEALWDSIYRNIPIGALVVRRQEGELNKYDLLDGQQRSNAIALGYSYSAFSKKDDEKYNSILWIDLKKANDGKYRFHVTTAAHPWGYKVSGDETKNELIELSDRRRVSKEINLEEGQVKPYPYQLYPVKADAPVPYAILRECVERGEGMDGLLEALMKAGVNVQAYEKVKALEKIINFTDISKKVQAVREYSVTLLDASGVEENDVALYFTRIGKGGVVPSKEELAYSVLKAKLGADFRKIIEDIRVKYGLAQSFRLASLAIRLYKSSEKEFYTGSIFDAVQEMCRDSGDGDGVEHSRFYDFVRNEFGALVEKVVDNGKAKLTQWHLTRYAMGHDGDVFLLLLLNERYKPCCFSGFDIYGLASLVFNYADQTDYAIKKMLAEGVQVGIARLSEEWRYSSARMSLPVCPDEYAKLLELLEDPDFWVEKFQTWKNEYPRAAEFIKSGYGNGRALDILIYACRESKENKQFGYDANLEIWTEESCPWDYDHIMPRNTIGKMNKTKGKKEKEVCEWLENSIGNLAPIPFSLNRSLSDAARTNSYPYSKMSTEQEALCLCDETNGKCNLEGMWSGERIDPLVFCRSTVQRFVRIYKKWYSDLGIAEVLDFGKVFNTGDDKKTEMEDEVIRRFRIFGEFRNGILNNESVAFETIGAGGKENEIESDDYRAFCASDYILLSQRLNGFVIAILKHRTERAWTIGLRKLREEARVNSELKDKIESISEYKKLGFHEGDQVWYLYKKVEEDVHVLREEEEDEQVIVDEELLINLIEGIREIGDVARKVC